MSEGVELKMYASKSEALVDMMDEVICELAELRADAERYRHLNRKAQLVDYSGGWSGIYQMRHIPAYDVTPYSVDRGQSFNCKSLNEAIDREIELEKKSK